MRVRRNAGSVVLALATLTKRVTLKHHCAKLVSTTLGLCYVKECEAKQQTHTKHTLTYTGDFMLKEARGRIEPITIRYCITIGSVSVAYFSDRADAIAQAADNSAPSRLGVDKCLSTFASDEEP